MEMESSRLRNTLRHLITTKFLTGETSSLERLGIYGNSDEYLSIVDRLGDRLLLQLNQELQKSPHNNDPPSAYLRAAVLRARFCKTIGGGESSAKRGRWEEKKEELQKIAMRKKVKKVEDDAKVALKDLCWPEDNVRVVMEFDLLINRATRSVLSCNSLKLDCELH